MRNQVEFIGFLLLLLLSSHVGAAAGGGGEMNLGMPKAYAIEYWDRRMNNKVERPELLLNKASPLSVSESAKFTQLAAQNSLSAHLGSFCKLADLYCFPADSAVEQSKAGRFFIPYANYFPPSSSKLSSSSSSSSNATHNRAEPGTFFREKMLKEGTVMPMPDIQDMLPRRSFLPRSISSKLPFSSSKVSQLKHIFHASNNSTMEGILKATLHECEKAPSPGETKTCVGSVEDMIDFAVSILGRSSVPRFTHNMNGSKKDILLGQVRGVHGGKVTSSVSCHQRPYPYLLYYCHSVPKVRVYEAEILDPITKAKINHGVAICHTNTSVWSPTHEAFLELGSGPGKIEVCHWIFQNDLTWTVAH